MRSLKRMVGHEVGVSLTLTNEFKEFNEEGEMIGSGEVNKVIISVLMDADDKFVYFGRNKKIDLVINIDKISMITTDPDIITEWVSQGPPPEGGEIVANKEQLN